VAVGTEWVGVTVGIGDAVESAMRGATLRVAPDDGPSLNGFAVGLASSRR
jgi:hypothetical protein